MEFFTISAKIFGGLALFLFSITLLSNNLKKLASLRIKEFLQKATVNPVQAVLTGTMVTFLVQSSSVTVLLLMGLVNAGVMNLRQAVYVILGSQIGTTITAQIVAFKIQVMFFPLLIIGFAMGVIASKQEKLRIAGDMIFSLGLLFFAMKIMADGSRPLKELPLFLELAGQLGSFPLYGIVLGAVLTAITSSSSATTGLVIAMSMEGVIELQAGIALIIGANIGTCVLELVAATRVNLAARRAAVAQFLINLSGVLLFYPVLDWFAELIRLTAGDVHRQIANAHTFFNMTVTLVLMPMVGGLVYLLEKLIRGEEAPGHGKYGRLDAKFLAVPALALAEAEEEVNRMAAITGEMLNLARQAFFEGDDQALKTVRETEGNVDNINEELGKYLNRINNLMLSDRDIRQKRSLVHCLTDIERVADLSENLAEYSAMENVSFSQAARDELEKLFDNASLAFSQAVKALARHRKSLVVEVGDLEDRMDKLEDEFRRKYLERLKEKGFTPMTDAFYPNVLQDLERITDHSNNIAQQVIKS